MSEPTDTQDFYTLTGYRRRDSPDLTAAMEDYLEMICRFAQRDGYARINTLAARLNVKPSSASRMAAHLRDLGWVAFEKYAIVTPTDRGRALGTYLLYRHEVLHRFFCALNGTENELEQVEKVEHFLTRESVRNLERLLPCLESDRARRERTDPPAF